MLVDHFYATFVELHYRMFCSDPFAIQLQKDTDMYADDAITHTAGKKLEVVEPKLQISAGDFNT